MRRTNPKISPESASAVWDAAQSSIGPECTVTAQCTLITPMYGGGITAGNIDVTCPIRASSLRGQLRFWWRLLNDTGQTSSELFAAESELWGGISKQGPRASRVTLHVGNKSVDEGQLVARKSDLAREKPPGFPPYALILKQGQDPPLFKAGYNFELVLRFDRSIVPRQREEVIEALRWWASFAGVGARTRRGFGAVRVVSSDVELKPVSAEEVRLRGGWMVTGRPVRNATEAWGIAIDKLREFRQGVNVGRNPGANKRPGRSRWPEADTIRRFKKTHAPKYEPEHPVDGYYPRAAFGLPLVFYFKDWRQGDPTGKENDSLSLNPAGHERMASPLILRPLFDGQGYRPAALLLPRWQERVSVRVSFDAGQETPAWPESPDERKRLGKQIRPMHAQEAADALSAFMGYF